MKPNKNTIKVIKEFSILIDKLIELKKVSNPIPEYKKAGISSFSDSQKKEVVIGRDGSSVEMPESMKNLIYTAKEHFINFKYSMLRYSGVEKTNLVESAIRNIDIEVSKLTGKVKDLEKDRRILSEELMFDKKPPLFADSFDKVKNEEPILKNAYEEINKTITEKCACERFVDLEGYKSVLIKECDYCKNKNKNVIDWNENYDYWFENIKDKESKEPYVIFQLRNIFGTYTYKQIINNPELAIKAKISLIETLKLF